MEEGGGVRVGVEAVPETSRLKSCMHFMYSFPVQNASCMSYHFLGVG